MGGVEEFKLSIDQTNGDDEIGSQCLSMTLEALVLLFSLAEQRGERAGGGSVSVLRFDNDE